MPWNRSDRENSTVLPFLRKGTPHEVRGGSFGPRLNCVRCGERALLEELDRD